jgi:translation initiation factor 3 subunit G
VGNPANAKPRHSNPHRANWADDEEFDDATALPPPQIIANLDGTKSIITYRLNDAGKKIKTTRKIRTTVVKEHVNPRVAERKEWVKFGDEKGHPPGPDLSTTSVGENNVFRPSANWKANSKEEDPSENTLREQLRDKKVACRICKGDHFTARCPFKDTLPPMDDAAADTGADHVDTGADIEQKAGGAYVAPHLRGKGRGGGEAMGGSGGSGFGGGRDRDRDDATLRVTNVSEFAEEEDLRDMFERFGRVTRVYLAKDRETGRAKGFAFVSYADRGDAERACAKMDGHGYDHLVLRVEFAQKAK